MLVIRSNQLVAKTSLKRSLALNCILLVLLITGVEAMHAHTVAPRATTSSPCGICLSVHTNAPAVAFHPLPTLSTLETFTVVFQTETRGIAQKLALFIRPPPAL